MNRGLYSSVSEGSRELEDYLKSNMTYDSQAGHLFWSKPSGKRRLGVPVGTLHSSGYLVFSAGFNRRRFSLRAHRVCWLLHYGEWPESFVDHIDRNRTNNRIANLREVSYRQNCQNQTKQVNNTSGYRGVSWSKCKGKWVVRIRTEGCYKFCGYFSDVVEAAKAYDEASLKYHKGFGGRNFDD